MATMLELKKRFRRATGLDRFYAVLGDEDGVVTEPGYPYLVRVRYTSANALGQPTVVRFRASMQKVPGTPVIVEYDDEDQLAVTKSYFGGQVAAGFSPVVDNAADEAAQFVPLHKLTPLHSHPVSTTADSMLVTVLDFIYIKDGMAHWFLGGAGDQSPIDLTSYIPGTSNTHLIALLSLDTTDDTIDIQVSTAIPIGDPFTLTEIQECLDAIDLDTSIPVWFWRLYNGQTGIRAGSLDQGGDDFLDILQFINIPSASGGSTNLTRAIARSYFGV